jgi:hypothetical protein
MTIRTEVIEHLVDIMREAESRGRDSIDAAHEAYPGIPDAVVWEAWALLERRKEEAWWQTVERTIEGEVIHRALASDKGGES